MFIIIGKNPADKLWAYPKIEGDVRRFVKNKKLTNIVVSAFVSFQNEWPRQGSNLRPPPCRGGALPAELQGRMLVHRIKK